MWLEQVVREETGCASYVIGAADTGECAVFDPLWEISPYIEIARRKGAKIRTVIDSHSHADHVSGARRLAQETRATLMLPAQSDVTYKAHWLEHGDRITMGEVMLEVIHVPGHRPEQINLLVTDNSRGPQPWCLLTADFILVGDVSRSDLAQEGQNGAAQLFDVALQRVRHLPDFVEVYPGHVAGSTCGRATSGKFVTTLGYERLYNKALRKTEREAFIAYMQAGQPSQPANMENIVAINQGRQEEPMRTPRAPTMSPQAVAQWAAEGHLVLDTRDEEAFGAGHIAGATNVQVSSGQFEQRVGWVLPPEEPFVVVAQGEAAAQEALHKLTFVGLDRRVAAILERGMTGWLEAGLPTRSLPQITVQELREALAEGRLQVLDVRDESEWVEGHIPGARNIPFRELEKNLPGGLGKKAPLAVLCAGGRRSSIASSILLRHGYENVHNVTGGMNAYEAAVKAEEF